MNEQIFHFFCDNHSTLSYLELNLDEDLSWYGKVWKLGNITWVLSLDIPQF